MARKFCFRFDSILSLKEQEEENKKAKLGMATQSLKQEEDHLFHLFEQKKTINNEIHIKTQNKLQIKDLQFLASKIAFVDQLIDRQKVTVNQWETQVNHCRVQLMEAKKQRKVFDILKEKDLEEYKYQQMKNEEMLLDQLVSYRSASK